MKADAQRRRCEAGLTLATACEEALGVSGPTALAALTGRSKSWWSKLASGVAAFPTWEELERLLPSGLTAGERESLHLRYRRAWLWRYDPEMLERLDSPVAVRCSLVEMHALLNTASALGYLHGDHRTALRLQKVLEVLLTARGIEALSREELDTLRECLDHQSVCEGELGNYQSAITIARRSADYQRAGGSRLGELIARHTVGLRLKNPAGSLTRALNEFEILRREYQRHGMVHELIRALRDGAVTKIDMGRRVEGEAELLQAYEVPRQSGEDRFLTLIWLADAALRRGDVPQARHWLATLRVISRRHAGDVNRLMTYHFVSRKVTELEGAAADPLPRRR